MVLEFCLAASQFCLIGLDFVKTAANLRRLLRRHAAVFVKFDWLVRHNRLLFPGWRHPGFAIPAHRTASKTLRPSLRCGSPQVCAYGFRAAKFWGTLTLHLVPMRIRFNPRIKGGLWFVFFILPPASALNARCIVGSSAVLYWHCLSPL